MTDHAYVPHPVWTTRDQCEYRLHDPNDENIGGICAMPRSAHPEEAHVLRIQLATALSDAAYFKASYTRKLEDERRALEAASALTLDLAAANARADAAEAAWQEFLKGNPDSAWSKLHAAQEALAAARRECEGLRKAGDRLLVLWADLTSQETYGEHLRAGLEKRDFEDWDEAHANLRVEMER